MIILNKKSILSGLLFTSICLAFNSYSAPGDLIRTYQINAYKLELDDINNKIYASIYSDNSIAVIDANTLEHLGTYFVGSAPAGLSLSPDSSQLYVATSGSNSLAVMDTSSMTVTSTITLPRPPFDVEAGNNAKAYVTPGRGGFSGYGHIMQVDINSGSFEFEFNDSVFVYYNGMLEISPDRNTLYFGNVGLSPGTLAKYDVSSNTPGLIYRNPHGSLGSNGQDLMLSHDGQTIYYAVGGGNRVSYGYDIATIQTSDMSILGAFNTGPYPREITLSPDDAYAYTINRSGSIKVWDTQTFLQAGTYPVSGEASELITDATGRYLFGAFSGQLRVFESEAPLNNPPIAQAGLDQSLECSSQYGALVLLDGSQSSDSDSTPGTNDDIAAFEWILDYNTQAQQSLGTGENLTAILPVGTHEITLLVTDRSGASSMDIVSVIIQDNTPPTLSVATDPSVLWPPNHKLIDITATVEANDTCSTTIVSLVDIVSNEADNGNGSGNSSADIQGADLGTDDAEFQLRAERSGNGNGRIYTIIYEASDNNGNTTRSSTEIIVPHDQGLN